MAEHWLRDLPRLVALRPTVIFIKGQSMGKTESAPNGLREVAPYWRATQSRPDRAPDPAA